MKTNINTLYSGMAKDKAQDVDKWLEVVDEINQHLVQRVNNEIGKPLALSVKGVALLLKMSLMVDSLERVEAGVALLVRALPLEQEDTEQVLKAMSTAGQKMAAIRKSFKQQVEARNEQTNKDNIGEARYSAGIVREPDWTHVIQRNKTVDIVAIQNNTQALLSAMDIECRYNRMTREPELLGGGTEGMQHGTIVTRVVGAANLEGYPVRTYIDEHLAAIADSNHYHPVAEWLSSMVWDGESRLDKLAGQLESDMNPEFKTMLIKRWMISAVQLAIEDTPEPAQGVLVLQGAQGMGKTTWLKSLCPVAGAVQTGVQVVPSDKDSVIKATGSWITELGELDATFKKADIAALKAFITDQLDRYRAPYARSVATHLRRTVFFGSVNDVGFLSDPTGNRRFWTIGVKHIDWNKLDMGQVWAEVVALYRAGESFTLSGDEMATLNESNQAFTAINDYSVAVEQLWGRASDYEPCELERVDCRLTMKEVYMKVQEVTGDERLSAYEKKQIKTALHSSGFEYKMARNTSGKLVRLWMLPLVK